MHGKRYRGLNYPMCEMGALLEAKAVHGGRSAYDHLLAWPRPTTSPSGGGRGARPGRPDRGGQEAVEGLLPRHSQRLGIAGAPLGDPQVLIFDQPVNGLDPEGIRWIRNLMQALAAEGRTVFVSSHLMSEMESTAQDIIVIGRGKLIADTTIDKFIAENSTGTVKVRTPQVDALAQAVAAACGTATSGGGDEALVVQGMTTDQVGDVAFGAGVVLHELSTHRASLEQAFMELTADSVEYQATAQPTTPADGSLTGGWRRRASRPRHRPRPTRPAPRPRMSTRGGRADMAAVTTRPAAARSTLPPGQGPGGPGAARCARKSPRCGRCAPPTGP